MSYEVIDELSGLVIDNFAKFKLAIGLSLGDGAHPESQEMTSQLLGYMSESGSLGEEGQKYFVGAIQGGQAIKRAYHSFGEALPSAILERDEIVDESLRHRVLDTFAHMTAGLSSSLGANAHPSSVEFADTVMGYTGEDRSLSDEGRDYVIGQIKSGQALERAYNSFVTAVTENPFQ